MAKKTTSTRTKSVPLGPVPVVLEPQVGDLPDAASEAGATEPNMPEATKEIPGTSDAATMATPETDAETEDKPMEKLDKSDPRSTVKEDTPPENALEKQLAEDDSQISIPEEPEKSLDHDTQELDDDLLEDAPRVEEVETEDRKRHFEEVDNEEVSPSKKLMLEVNSDGSVKTIRCEE